MTDFCLFQPNVFQNNVFQNCGSAPVPVTPAVGGLGKRRRRHLRIKVGDEEFDVFDAAEAERILSQLREAAQETAEAVAVKVVARVARAKTPAARERALIAKAPQISLVGDRSDELAQQLQAKIDAAQAAVEAIYRQMITEAMVRFEQDEEDALFLLLS